MLAAFVLAAAAALPPVPIVIDAPPSMSRHAVKAILSEASTIWRESGVQLEWEIVDPPHARALRIVIDDNTGAPAGVGLAVGWVLFDGQTPRPEIHLSRSNVVEGLSIARGARAAFVKDWFIDDALVVTALGRALAHELGHYLLGSTLHGPGLMQAEWMPLDVFGPDRPLFHLTAADRRVIAAKISEATMVAQQ